MKKLLKIVGWGLAGLVVLALAGVVTVRLVSQARLEKTYAVTVRPVKIGSDAATVARGKHIAETRGCADCHGADYGGGKVFDDGAMGRLYGTNLTRGTGSRVANWKDEDWVRAIRHGVGPDGRGLWLMPAEEYTHLSDEDLGAVIAFLKTVPPVNRERPATAPGPVSRVLFTIGKMYLSPEKIDHAKTQPATMTPAATADYGRYLAAGCIGCHGTNYAGGKIEIGPPDWPPAANLTPHPDARIAKWSEADFIAVLRTAKRPDGTEMNPVMPRTFGKLDDTELKALYAFFKTLPPVAHGAR